MINHGLIEKAALFGFEMKFGFDLECPVEWDAWVHEDRRPMAEQLLAEARGMA